MCSADKLYEKIDCFGQSPRNDGVEGNELLYNGNEEYLSLRGDLLPKQSTNKNNRLFRFINKSRNDRYDFVILPKANLAMTNPPNPTHSDS